MKSSTKTLLQLSLGIAVLLAAIPLLLQPTESGKKAQKHAENTLKVVVSIAPLHSLVAGIMEGVGEPHLLLKAGETPHHYSLKPRDVERISDADVIIASSFAGEYYLSPLLDSLKDRPKLRLQMIDAEGILLLPPKDSDEADAGHDLHIWLDPQNAIAFSKQVAAALAEYAPEHATIFNKNLKTQIEAIVKIDESLKDSIPDSSVAGYVSYHSVLQYFENRYRIKSGESAVAAPEAGASVLEAETLYKQAEAGEIKCVLAETEFSAKLLDDVAAKHPEIKRVVLNPLGGQFEPSAKLYGQLMQHVSEVVSQCLK